MKLRRLFRIDLERLRGLFRVMVFFTVVSAISSFFVLRNASAEAEKRAEDLGRKLLVQLGPLVLEDPATVRINGQKMFLASSVTTLDAQEVMAQMKSYCRENSGGLAEAIGKLPTHARGQELPAQVRDPASWFTVQSDAGEKDFGQIGCFVRKDQTTIKGFVERLVRLTETGDLSALGDMRYVVARGVREKTTHVLATWTEGSFRIADMFPESGDAPGSDSPNVPRPPDSVRLLTADFEGQPYSARIYETSRGPDEVLAFYDQQMKTRGFTGEPVWKERLDDKGLTAKPSYARAFTKDGMVTIMSAQIEPVLEKSTQVSFVEIGTRGTVRAEARASVLP